MKSFLFLCIGLLLIMFLLSCKPGKYSIGGYDYDIVMPSVELTSIPKTLAYAYIGITGNSLLTAPQAETKNHQIETLIGLGTTEQPIIVNGLTIYNISVKDLPEITPQLTISMGIRPVKIIRGPDLDARFGLFYNNNSILTIRPKEVLDANGNPQQNDLLRPPQIKGIVALVICETPPVVTGMTVAGKEIVLVERKEMSIAKFPIQVKAIEAAGEINQVDLVVKASNFLWLSPGNFFPNTIIEKSNDQTTSPQDGLEFLVQNITCTGETEILAPPENQSLPGVDFLLVNKLGEIDVSLGGKSFTLKLPGNNAQKDQPKRMPSVWGKIKSN